MRSRVALLKPENLQFMTPPLATRRNNKGLKSPASSPNLSVRSAVSSPPPIIKIDVLESPDGSTEYTMSPGLPGSSDTGANAHSPKLFQLPPVNTWVPKGESLFTSILDQRSPQVYRRTPGNSTKTVSYPPTAQAQLTLQSTRVSWPQDSQAALQSTEPVPPSAKRPESETQPGESSKATTGSKSPRLLRKCTSFDLERSKPFPARSIMTSPLNIRKGLSLEESGIAHIESKDLSKYPDSENKSGVGSIVHTEVDETSASVEGLNAAPSCESHVDSSLQYSTVDSLAGESQVKCTQSSVSEITTAKSNSDKPETKSPTVNVDDLKLSSPVDEETVKLSEIEADKGSEIVGSDTAGLASVTNETSDIGKKIDSSKKGVPDVKKKVANTKETTKVRSKTKASDKSVTKTVKSSSSEKGPSKKPASTVKTAFLSSAAKLKSFGRKSPVTLLSYKSKSISIPDQSRKSGRPSSTSEINTDKKGLQRKIHQTESSPTVLVADVSQAEDVLNEAEICAAMTRSATALSVKSEPPKHKPSLSQSPARSGAVSKKPTTVTDKKIVKSPTAASTNKKPEKKDKLALDLKASVDKSVKSSQSKVSSPIKDKPVHVPKTSQTRKSSLTVAPKAVPESSTMRKIKKSTDRSVSPSTKTDRTKVKHPKRGSISSVNSDSAKPTDHFRDCCHGRRRTDKK